MLDTRAVERAVFSRSAMCNRITWLQCFRIAVCNLFENSVQLK